VAPQAYVGTSGWNYKHWRNLIYPPKFAQKRWLGFMVERFDTVEVNTSFYRIPTQETIAAWQDATPEHFKFAMKLWRGITHYKKLVAAAEFSRRFLDVIDVLEPARRAPLLIQLPPNQGKDVAKLDAYLAELAACSPSPGTSRSSSATTRGSRRMFIECSTNIMQRYVCTTWSAKPLWTSPTTRPSSTFAVMEPHRGRTRAATRKSNWRARRTG
jgi:uncharacterized protein YecE (DUF72 family)